MRFTVTWHTTALDELSEIWLAVHERVSLAAALVDRVLADDPQTKGDEYYGDRIIVVDTIEIRFKVLELDRVVRIVEVRGH